MPRPLCLGDPTWVPPPPSPTGLKLRASTRRLAPSPSHAAHRRPPTMPSASAAPAPRSPPSPSCLFLSPAGSAGLRGHGQALDLLCTASPIPSARCPVYSQIKSTAFLQKRSSPSLELHNFSFVKYLLGALKYTASLRYSSRTINITHRKHTSQSF